MQRLVLRLSRVALAAHRPRASAAAAARAISSTSSLHAASGSDRASSSPPRIGSTVRRASSVPALGRRRTSRAQVVGDLEALVHEAKHQGGRFQPSMDFLRRASTVLQLCKTREQCTAAIPLCHIVEKAAATHGKAKMECVRIYQKAGRNQEVVALAEKLMGQDVFLLNQALASAIQACASLGQVDKGFQFFDAAVKRGSIPNLSVYSALLAVAGAAGTRKRCRACWTRCRRRASR